MGLKINFLPKKRTLLDYLLPFGVTGTLLFVLVLILLAVPLLISEVLRIAKVLCNKLKRRCELHGHRLQIARIKVNIPSDRNPALDSIQAYRMEKANSVLFDRAINNFGNPDVRRYPLEPITDFGDSSNARRLDQEANLSFFFPNYELFCSIREILSTAEVNRTIKYCPRCREEKWSYDKSPTRRLPHHRDIQPFDLST